MICKYLLATQMVFPATDWCDADFLLQIHLGQKKKNGCGGCKSVKDDRHTFRTRGNSLPG